MPRRTPIQGDMRQQGDPEAFAPDSRDDAGAPGQMMGHAADEGAPDAGGVVEADLDCERPEGEDAASAGRKVIPPEDKR